MRTVGRKGTFLSLKRVEHERRRQRAEIEFGGVIHEIVLPLAGGAATAFADTLRAGVESLEFPRFPGLRCSISLGLAPPPDAGLGLREWLEAADRALYEAKQGGRNRTAGRGATPRG